MNILPFAVRAHSKRSPAKSLFREAISRSLLATALVVFAADVSGVCCPTDSVAFGQTLAAFPTAEGFGANAVGGRGGSVYHVTNLNDNGAGSLRYGIDSAAGPTTIVFDVGGTIQLQSTLTINRSNLTIAGQTAPGAGIEIVGNTTAIYGNDDIVRYLRFRAGDQESTTAQDSLTVTSSNNVVIDHVSASWGIDETLSVTLSNNVTVQNSIVAETLNRNAHSDGSLVRGQVSSSTPGGYTFSHNLWISNDIRNPGIGSLETYDAPSQKTGYQLQLDLVNNVIYNWGSQAVHTVESSDDIYLNMVNNMFIAGPSTTSPNEVFREEPEQSSLFGYQGRVNIYDSGNMIDSNKNTTLDPVATNHTMFKKGMASWPLAFAVGPYPYPAVTTQSATDAYQQVLANVGDSLQRDSVDQRLITQVSTQGGAIITSQNQVGGYPILAATARPAGWDTDGDGIPDSWELAHGLSPYVAGDGVNIASNGYTNLENYLNSLTGEVIIAPSPTNMLHWSGTNTWDAGVTANWSTASGGPYNQTAWAANSHAVFEGTAGTVTVSGNIDGVKSILFTTDGYTLGGTGTLTFAGGGNIAMGAGTDTINCTIAGNGGLTKSGSGTLILGGANTYTGGTTVMQGTLALGSSGALPSGNDLAVNSVLDLHGYAANVNGLSGGGVIVNNAPGTTCLLTAGGNDQSSTFAGVIQDGGAGRIIALNKTGSGTLALTGANTYTGGTTVSAGTLEFDGTGSVRGNILNNATLAFNNANNNWNYVTFAGNISGSGSVTLTGGSYLSLTGTNTYSGGTTIGDYCILLVGYGGTTGSIAGNVTNNGYLAFYRSDSLTFSGNISGSGYLYQIGYGGTLTLSGKNTYTGPTVVAGGTLRVTGSLANNGSNNVFVAKDYNGVIGDGLGDSMISRRVAAGGTYAGLGSAITELSTGELATTADIVAGTASAQTDVSMAWRTLTTAEKTQAGGGLISEILSLNGIAPSGTGVRNGVRQTDMFVLQMSYDPSQLSSIWGLTESQAVAQDRLSLAYLDNGTGGLFGVGFGDGSWIRAVDGNFGGTPNFVGNHAYNSSYFVLGDYGVDTTNHVVWAVMNYSGQFAAVPEPSTLVLVTIGTVSLMAHGWKRRRAA
jgi:autotransporter-associated beta strand protein